MSNYQVTYKDKIKGSTPVNDADSFNEIKRVLNFNSPTIKELKEKLIVDSGVTYYKRATAGVWNFTLDMNDNIPYFFMVVVVDQPEVFTIPSNVVQENAVVPDLTKEVTMIIRGHEGRAYCVITNNAKFATLPTFDDYSYIASTSGSFTETTNWYGSDATLSFWWKQGNFDKSGGANVISTGGGGTTARFRLEPVSNAIIFALYTDLSNYNVYTFNTGGDSLDDILDGQWHHLCLTWDYDTETALLYIDGIAKNAPTLNAVGSFDKDNIAEGSPSLNAGGGSSSNFLDDVAVIKQTLNATQVAELYNNGVPFDVRSLYTPDFYVIFEEATGNWVDQMQNYTISSMPSGGEFSTNTPTNPRFRSILSRQDETATRYEANESFGWATADRTYSVWFKTINAISGANWNIFSEAGWTSGGAAANRINLISSVYDEIHVELRSGTDGGTIHTKQVRFGGFSSVIDGEWHHLVVTWDYTNAPANDSGNTVQNFVAAYLDGVELTQTGSSTPGVSWTKAAILGPASTFTPARGSNQTGGDLVYNPCAISKVVSTNERLALYNNGVPQDVRNVIPQTELDFYISFEFNEYRDLAGNFTFTEVAAGGSFVEDVPA